jgi:hypothetical protein
MGNDALLFGNKNRASLSKSRSLDRHRSEGSLLNLDLIPQGAVMQYMLMDYVQEAGWHKLARAEQDHWLGAYRAYMQAMQTAGVLKSSAGLHSASTAATVRVADTEMKVMDGPYADTKEQLGGFHLIEVPSLDAALAWAARSPTALHGVVEVRAVRDGTMLTRDLSELLKPE